MLRSKRIYIGEFIPLSTVGRQTFPYRIMEGLPVTREQLDWPCIISENLSRSAQPAYFCVAEFCRAFAIHVTFGLAHRLIHSRGML